MLPGVNIGNKRTAVGRGIEKRVWRDNSDRILKRGQNVKCEAELVWRMPFGDWHALRSNKAGTLAVGDQFIDFLGRCPFGLAFPSLWACSRQTGQSGAT